MPATSDVDSILEGCAVGREAVERLEIVGPTGRLRDVVDRLREAGFTTISRSAYSDRAIFPRCDHSRFFLIVERTVKA